MATETQKTYKNSPFVPNKTSFKANDDRVIIGWNSKDRRRDETAFPEFPSNPDEISGFSSSADLYACWGYEVNLQDDEHAKIRVSPDNNPKSSSKKYLRGQEVVFSADVDNGYAFYRWGDGSEEYPRTVEISCNSVEKVETQVVNYSISYELHTGNNNPDNPNSYNILTPTITLKDPTLENYRFLGWSPSNTIPYGSYGDKKFEAKWTKKQWYSSDLGTNGVSCTVEHDGHVAICHNGGNNYGYKEYGSMKDEWWTDIDHVYVYVNGSLQFQLKETSNVNEKITVKTGDVVQVDLLFKDNYKTTDGDGNVKWIRQDQPVYSFPSSIGYVKYQYYH